MTKITAILSPLPVPRVQAIKGFITDESGIILVKTAIIAALGSFLGVFAGIVGSATASFLAEAVSWVSMYLN